MLTKAFVCQMCGACCQGEGGIVVSSRDVRRLCEHLDVSPEELAAQYLADQGAKRRLASRDGWCVFYDPEQGCTVHPGRPDVCRAWPFFRGNLLDEESFVMAREDCPGIRDQADHARFVEEGEQYLIQEDLWGYGDPEAPNALFSGPESLRRRVRIAFGRK